MEGIYSVIADFMVDAAKIACFMGVLSYGVNMLLRACTGKEVIL